MLDAGSTLLEAFYKMQNVLKNCYSKVCQENQSCKSELIKSEICMALEEFDFFWATFEQIYVSELMYIEKQARRYVLKGINVEKELESFEIREKLKGKLILNKEEYHNLRKSLCKVISEINSVANVEGKGRDDLDYQILFEAEGIIRKVTKEQSKAVRILADKIRNDFLKLRHLFKKYEENIEMVDPQLKNNTELVNALMDYEASWEKGKHYFLDSKTTTYLIHFSHIIETTVEKYREFQEKIECRDVDIFVTIPCLVILKSLDEEDKKICEYFLPDIKNNEIYLNLKIDFDKWKITFQKSYNYYNILEKIIIGIKLNEIDSKIFNQNKNNVEQMIHRIKQFSMELQRNNPSEWNNFLDAALV